MAICTVPEEIERVVGQVKTVAFGNLLLETLDFIVLELDDLMTSHTDEVIVVGTGCENFKNRFPISKLLLVDEASFFQKIERPIDGRQSWVLLIILKLTVEILRAHVSVHPQKFFDDEVSLLTLLELGFGQILFKLVPEPTIILQSFANHRHTSSGKG